VASVSHILIVDDDETLRTSLAEQFQLHEGFIVHQAADGEGALELLEKHQYAAVLLDVGLPDTDGRDLCRLMRRRQGRRSGPDAVRPPPAGDVPAAGRALNPRADPTARRPPASSRRSRRRRP